MPYLKRICIGLSSLAKKFSALWKVILVASLGRFTTSLEPSKRSEICKNQTVTHSKCVSLRFSIRMRVFFEEERPLLNYNEEVTESRLSKTFPRICTYDSNQRMKKVQDIYDRSSKVLMSSVISVFVRNKKNAIEARKCSAENFLYAFLLQISSFEPCYTHINIYPYIEQYGHSSRWSLSSNFIEPCSHVYQTSAVTVLLVAPYLGLQSLPSCTVSL